MTYIDDLGKQIDKTVDEFNAHQKKAKNKVNIKKQNNT